MRLHLILPLLILPTAALPDDYCLQKGAEHPAYAADLATDWQGNVVQFLTVTAGKPQLGPGDDSRKPASFTAEGENLLFSDATTKAAVTLTPSNGAKWDFALPGEAPLAAEELLSPMLATANIACPVEFLPQFFGTTQIDASATVEFHAYVLTPHHMMMVIQFHPADQAAANGLRAVIDFIR